VRRARVTRRIAVPLTPPALDGITNFYYAGMYDLVNKSAYKMRCSDRVRSCSGNSEPERRVEQIRCRDIWLLLRGNTAIRRQQDRAWLLYRDQNNSISVSGQSRNVLFSCGCDAVPPPDLRASKRISAKHRRRRTLFPGPVAGLLERGVPIRALLPCSKARLLGSTPWQTWPTIAYPGRPPRNACWHCARARSAIFTR
jgi:hypothetical protein